ncbi:uncharacterized protein LOC128202541 [Galleria mellonella]|uniref:Uncharacterized protein LOC128202541 n=1 Tax=Galleria mellonella TaxID=7137 RepID=A0ABM3N6J3_GALME|nr:uncharacterized protein LOC128202541 [Galleria mellonella]
MYSFFTIIVCNVAYSHCLAEYELFPGFDMTSSLNNTTETDFDFNIESLKIDTTDNQTSKPVTENIIIASTINTTFECPEEERPSNIGPYEVPTQRDLVLLIRKTLSDMFNSYHEKALYLLKDIKEATKATSDIEKKCQGNKYKYRKCVRKVSTQCQFITKSLVSSLERQRQDVTAFTNDKICNMTSMKLDPLQLVNTLAMEEASLEFSLPGFLRLLNSCSFHCSIGYAQTFGPKPLRHITDQELVVKHFLTKKDYIQLMNV